MATLKLTKTKDNTITVVYGNYREAISTDGKSQMELLDAVRWAVITAGGHLDEDAVWDLIQEL